MVYKVLIYIVLIILYIYFFGHSSFTRFKEESIVTIRKNLDISSLDFEVKPGGKTRI